MTAFIVYYRVATKKTQASPSCITSTQRNGCATFTGLERAHITRILRDCNFNQTDAARRLCPWWAIGKKLGIPEMTALDSYRHPE